MAPVITARLSGYPAVYEGIAIRPGLLVSVPDALGVLLNLSDAEIRACIQTASDYAPRTKDHQYILDGLIGRCLLDR